MLSELKQVYLRAFYGDAKFIEKYGDVLEVAIELPTETHAAYPNGGVLELKPEVLGGFR